MAVDKEAIAYRESIHTILSVANPPRFAVLMVCVCVCEIRRDNQTAWDHLHIFQTLSLSRLG